MKTIKKADEILSSTNWKIL